MKIKASAVIIFLGFLSLVFQNCSKSNFEPVTSSTYFKAESIPDATQVTSTDVSVPSSADISNSNSNVSTADVVECELLGQNQKIVLASDLAIDSSNSESSRVCMSGYACVKLINSYAAEHNCSLDKGAVSSPGSQTKCAQKFPGSQGVCDNARFITDHDVQKILELMGQ